MTTKISGSSSIFFGALLIVLAFFCVAVMSALGKAASAVPASVLVLFQNGISLLLLLPWALRHGLTDLRTTRLPLHLVRALSGLLSQALFFIAVKHMTLVDAVLLVNAAPLFIPLVMLLWFGAKIAPVVWWGLSVGFAGVLLILQPSAAMFDNPAALIATAAALFSAIALVSVNRLAETDAPDTILFYYFLISTAAAGAYAVMDWSTPRGEDWWLLIGVGVTMALAQLFIVLAYRFATAAQISPFNYSVVVFSGLIGWWVWGNVPNSIALIGIALVCAGGILAIAFGGPSSKGHSLGHGHWVDTPRNKEASP